MSRKTSRQIVIGLSVLVAAIGFGYFGYLRFEHQTSPLWDKVAMTYGGVFLVFLFFDEIGRLAAQHRREKDAAKERPRPRPSQIPGQQIALAPGHATKEQIRLERVKGNDTDTFVRMVDSALEEVLALDNILPNRDEHGHVVGVPTQEWLNTSRFYPFYILIEDAYAGCCLYRAPGPDSSSVLELFYIHPDERRQRVGTHALVKLSEFVGMLGVGEEMTCNVSKNNMRGQRFLQRNGFQVVNTDDSNESVTMSKRFISQ